ncbi:YceK/YidQ family lipoprotein [Microbulbifer magnicolonia]|uniref:YceK/YidQ family lipoprotein n=1 Tax=Microbulbifer magnicolonia TaxID=3109744 RepID=UPI002B407FB4|nr:YceK/YidQ family lipoprotein [Microbulbifer sp. GG15]
MKLIWILLATISLTACGTFNTLAKSDHEIAANLKRQKSNCESIPRVYSGVSYNMCQMNSNKHSIYYDWMLGFYLLDSVASAATDTIALPYTAYSQSRKGHLVIDEQ